MVLGLGNILCGDDGLGTIVVSALDRGFEHPREVEVLDGGTLGLALLPHLERADATILVDAVAADSPPGSFVRLEGAEVAPAVERRLSAHQVGVADLLDGARWLDCYPDRIILLGLVPAATDLGIGCSPAVRASLPLLLDRVVEEIRGFGFDLTLTRGTGHEVAGILDGSDLDRVLGLSHGTGRRPAPAVSRDAGTRRAPDVA